ncbi:hypothetical protein [Latilactobacillus sp. VITA-14]|uniref:hypothetical protein n=1 Tax=Latilactobacillus sp. VITA-14 TaxID=3367745 RepID=UPI003982A187
MYYIEQFVRNSIIGAERLYISKGLVAFYILYFLGTIGVIFVVFPVLHLLKPTFLFSTIVYVGMSIYMFLWQQQSIAASYISNTNDIPYVKSFLYSSVVGVIFAYLLTKYSTLGIWGIILGLGFVQLLYNNWKWLLVVFKRVDLNLFKVIENGLKAWVGKYKF